MEQFSKFIGLDVHKETIAVSVAPKEGEVRFWGEIPNTLAALVKLLKQLSKDGERLSFCYEAGGCGYIIYRQLLALNQDCWVVAPSLIPRKAGDRVKTDRRDSLNLARLHRAGELTAVWTPDLEQEALRDLTRGREDMKHLQRQAKQRLLAMLLRYGHRFDGQGNWTQAHFRWLEGVKFDYPAQQIMFQEYIDTIIFMGQRVGTADLHIEQTAQSGATWPVIQALMALRGVNLLTAATVVAEIGDLKRFVSASKLMAFLGLVPSEHSSANSVRRGGITKTGNSHVRRVLTEAAWTYRFAARKTAVIQRRAERTPEAVQAIAWKAQQRLCQRYQQLNGKGKLKVQVCTAIARELSGFIWAIGQSMPALKPTINR